MRLLKEVTFLFLTAIAGMFVMGFCTDIFSPKVTGALLKYGGLVCSGFLVVSQRLSAATGSIESLDDFDETTRKTYVTALSEFKIRFRHRFVVGLVLSAIAATCGVIVAEWETKDIGGQMLLSAIGGALLVPSAVMVGGQLLASAWPAEFLANTSAIARADKKRLEKVARYADENSFRPDKS